MKSISKAIIHCHTGILLFSPKLMINRFNSCASYTVPWHRGATDGRDGEEEQGSLAAKGDREQERASLLWRFLATKSPRGAAVLREMNSERTPETYVTCTVTVKSHENELRGFILPREPPALHSHKTWAKALECSTDKSKEELPASVGTSIRAWPVIRLLIYTEILTEAHRNEGPSLPTSGPPCFSRSVLQRKSQHRCSWGWQACLMSYSVRYNSLGEVVLWWLIHLRIMHSSQILSTIGWQCMNSCKNLG